MTREFAVVIPVRNGASTIGAQLDALAADATSLLDGRGGEAVTVIVADNGSTDDLVSACHDRPGLDITVVDASDTPGAGPARNVGAIHAGSADLLFCDADDQVRPGWMAALLTGLVGHGVVGGRLDDQRLNDLERRSRPSPSAHGLPAPSGFRPFAASCNLAVRRDVWDALGGMRVDYETSEDIDFSWRAAAAGHSIGWAPDAVIDYRHRTTTRGIFDQARRSGRSMAQLYGDYRAEGLAGRSTADTVRDWIWSLTRMPYLLDPGRRGLWIRRFGQVVGRIEGSLRHGVRYL